jgi:hypothetical protein
VEQAYVYKWTHLPSLMWYVGSRTSKNAHPNDGYICSSKIVKPLIQATPEEWSREIIEVGTRQAMKKLEAEILQLFDAAADPRSFNKNNAKPAGGWNAGLNGEQSHRFGKRLNYKKPYTVTEKFLIKQRELNAIRNSEKAVCPHCKKEGQMIAMKRWHFEKCKFKGEL